MTAEIQTIREAKHVKHQLFDSYSPRFLHYQTSLEMNFGELSLHWQGQEICRELVNFAEINNHLGTPYLTAEDVTTFLMQNRDSFKALKLFKQLCQKSNNLFHDYRVHHPYVEHQLTAYGLRPVANHHTDVMLDRAASENVTYLREIKLQQVPYMQATLQRIYPTATVAVNNDSHFVLTTAKQTIAVEQISLDDNESIKHENQTLPQFFGDSATFPVYKKFCELTTTFMLMYQYALNTEIIKNY